MPSILKVSNVHTDIKEFQLVSYYCKLSFPETKAKEEPVEVQMLESNCEIVEADAFVKPEPPNSVHASSGNYSIITDLGSLNETFSQSLEPFFLPLRFYVKF